MVLQVGADPVALDPHRDAVFRKMSAGPDSGQHQQLRRAEHAAGQHHRAPCADDMRLTPARISDAPHPPVVEQYAFDQHVGEDIDVCRRLAVAQIGARRGPALTVALRHLIDAQPLLPRAVEILILRNLQLPPGLDEIAAALIGVTLIADPQRPFAAVKAVAAALIVLGSNEIGQHVVIRPAGRAERGPVIVIPFVAANIDHRVDRR